MYDKIYTFMIIIMTYSIYGFFFSITFFNHKKMRKYSFYITSQKLRGRGLHPLLLFKKLGFYANKLFLKIYLKNIILNF